MKPGVVRYQFDCKPKQRGARECGQLEILGRESAKPLTLGTPNENKVGVGAAIQKGALKGGELSPFSVSLAFAEFHDHGRFKSI